MKFLIIDDDIAFIKKLQSDLLLYFEYDESICIETISDNFYRSFDQSFDVAFVDIDLQNKNGIDIAAQLKNRHVCNDVIFISAHTNFVFNALTIHPLYFFRKMNYETDFNVMIGLIQKFLKSDMYININHNRCKLTLSLKDIIFIESQDHLLIIHTRKQVFNDSRTLQLIEKELPGEQFVRIHKSFIINMNYLIKLDSTFVVLAGNHIISLGRKYKDEFKQKYKEFLVR